MEESKPHPRRLAGAPQRRSLGGAKAPSSAHVIDLRQGRPAAARPSTPAAVAPARAKRRPKLALPRRHQAQPTPPPPPAASSRLRPPAKPARKPVAVPSRAAVPPIGAESAAPILPPRRFWPAFWRFLILLVVLGVLVIGGLYLYVNYYRN